MMRTFTLFITDTRYRVPTFALLTVDDEQRAIELAKRTLIRSAYHLAVEVHDGKGPVFREERAA